MQKPNICIIEDRLDRIVGVDKNILSQINSEYEFLKEYLSQDWGFGHKRLVYKFCGTENYRFRYTHLSLADITKRILEAEKILGPDFGGDSLLFLREGEEPKYMPRSAWNGIIQLGVDHFLEVSKTLDHEINRSQEMKIGVPEKTVKFRRPLPVCWEQEQKTQGTKSDPLGQKAYEDVTTTIKDYLRSVKEDVKNQKDPTIKEKPEWAVAIGDHVENPEIDPKEPEYVLDSFGMKVHPVTGQPIDTWIDFSKIPI